MRISDWSSDVCSSDLGGVARGHGRIARGVHPLELRARHVLVLCQFPIALVVGLGLAYAGLARVQLGAGCIDLTLLFDRTQAHQHGSRGAALLRVTTALGVAGRVPSGKTVSVGVRIGWRTAT